SCTLHRIEQWPERFAPESGKACLNYCERLPTWDPHQAPWYNAFWPLQNHLLQIARRPILVERPHNRVSAEPPSATPSRHHFLCLLRQGLMHNRNALPASPAGDAPPLRIEIRDRKSTRPNSTHTEI